MCRQIAVTFFLTIAILNVCHAQEPPVVHRQIDARSRRSAQLIDEAVVASTSGRFRPEFQNLDRIHLNITFSSLPLTRVGLLVSESMGEPKAIETHIAVLHSLGWLA